MFVAYIQQEIKLLYLIYNYCIFLPFIKILSYLSMYCRNPRIPSKLTFFQIYINFKTLSGFHEVSCWELQVSSGFHGVSSRESWRLAFFTVWKRRGSLVLRAVNSRVELDNLIRIKLSLNIDSV